jgi:imidazolonepropionase-like amidohydrolase
MWLATAALSVALAAPAQGLVLRHARVVDAQGAREVGDLLVVDGRIAALGPDLAVPEGTLELDAAGATVLPGLIDSHVHLSLSPSGAFRERTAAQLEAERRHHLRAYVASGVTTVLDTGIPLDDARAVLQYAAEGPAPRIALLGPLLSPAGGYVSVVLPRFAPAASPADVAAQLDAFAPLDPVGVKLTVERGMLTEVWPLYSDAVQAAILDETRARGTRRFVHAISAEECELALELEPYAYVHANEAPSDAWLATVVERGTYVMTTLAILDSTLVPFEPERLDDPLVQLAVPADQRAAAIDPAVNHASRTAILAVTLPSLPSPLRRVAVWGASLRAPTDMLLDAQLDAVGRMNDAGVALVLGSDSGNWPVFLAEFHGPTTVRELELLVDAGLTPLEALTAATATPARMLGLDGELGAIAVGMAADLLVVDGDPLADITAVRRARWVIRDGEARTPAAWMSR